MSRHRDAVIQALEALRVCAARSLDVDVLGAVQSNPTSTITLDLLSDRQVATVPVSYVAELNEVLAALHVDELREAKVILEVRSFVRQAACVTEGNLVTQRNLQVADVLVRARLRTRWVNMWQESNRRVEWPTA
jgi:hypothetical protein